MQLLLLALLLLLSLAARAQEISPATLAELDRIVASGVQTKVYPGAVLAVGQAGKLRWTKAYGRLTYEPNAAPVTTSTLFDLASVSKPLATSMAAMLALEDGAISLDTEIADLLPAYAKSYPELTLRHLLTHTSGLPAYLAPAGVEKTRRPEETKPDALIRSFAALKPSAAPGRRMVYSCLNMQTLARAIETARGERLDNLLRERIWVPLGLANSTFQPNADLCAPTARRGNGTLYAGIVHDPIAGYHGVDIGCPGNAGLFSTADDVATLLEMMLNGGEWGGRRVLKRETVAQMLRPQTDENIEDRRAFGWDIWDREPYRTPSHAFGHTGFTGTFVWADPGAKTYVVLLTNAVFPKPEGVKAPGTAGVHRQLVETLRKAVLPAKKP